MIPRTIACVILLCARPAVAGAQQTELLAPGRIESLPSLDRAAWTEYVAASHRAAALDRAAMAAELKAVGRSEWTVASEGANHVVGPEMTPEWFRSPEARRMAEVILSFQTPAGGWSKQLDLRSRPRQPGESWASSGGWSWIATFDNEATTGHLLFLARTYAAHPEDRFREAFLRGLDFVFRSQFPNGCWPQSFPLKGSYHDAVTFNDDVMARILRLLREVAEGKHELAPEEARLRAGARVQRGVNCILASQVRVNGRPTVWGAQHDPLTLEPVKARTYEHASLSGGESVGLFELLMEIQEPDARVVEAVHAAADWFRKTAIQGFEYSNGELVAKEGAGPLWARFYEIGTDRPIFSSRDGMVLYRLDQVEQERRTGYAWYRRDAASALRRYERWAARHPRRGPAPGPEALREVLPHMVPYSETPVPLPLAGEVISSSVSRRRR